MKHSINTRAQQYATAQHAGQFYDGFPYTMHLEQVHAVCCNFTHLLPDLQDLHHAFAGAWVHDVIEDCRVTYNDVKAATNEAVAEIAYLLATPKGRSRADRHCDAYYEEMSRNRLATFVKIADRIANAEYSRDMGSSMLNRYRSEQAHFAKFLRPAWLEFEPMWHRLDATFA
ncbi:phosphohydrolase [Hymenobacter latericus]|uniref:phosphohydrolase n=1 Tax=Hymenobacter sp. YIM 151858-1 TaxID=2987688 RepID=UPI0022270CDD|nr:phosphohydrolase [Hymenobacter sp. YIM 151858-1]UYZ60096.1 phosphohydrolase [Hymenobacter sp. YIM 151858-1]